MQKNKTSTVPNPTTNPNPNHTIDEARKRKVTSATLIHNYTHVQQIAPGEKN